MSSCPPHQWQVTLGKDAECPYGWKFFEVTWPDPHKAARFASVSADWMDADFHQGPIANLVFVMYGYIPFALILVAFVALVKNRATRELFFFTYASCSVLLNEMILKRIVYQQRPEHSCLSTCGMPSGHSTLAMGYFTLCFLDVLFRVHPPSPQAHTHALPQSTKERCQGILRRFWFTLKNAASLIPLASKHSISHAEALCDMCIWALFLLPVPLSRVAVRDHTPTQVFVGSTIGVIEAAVANFIGRGFQKNYWKHAGRKLFENRWCELEHTYVLPAFEFIRIAKRTSEQAPSELPQDERDSLIVWYTQQDPEDLEMPTSGSEESRSLEHSPFARDYSRHNTGEQLASADEDSVGQASSIKVKFILGYVTEAWWNRVDLLWAQSLETVSWPNEATVCNWNRSEYAYCAEFVQQNGHQHDPIVFRLHSRDDRSHQYQIDCPGLYNLKANENMALGIVNDRNNCRGIIMASRDAGNQIEIVVPFDRLHYAKEKDRRHAATIVMWNDLLKAREEASKAREEASRWMSQNTDSRSECNKLKEELANIRSAKEKLKAELNSREFAEKLADEGSTSANKRRGSI